MRKRNRYHLTAEEKQEIRRLTLEGKRNVDICRKLKVNRNTIHYALVRMGLPITRRPALPRQKEALVLLRQGWGPRRVASELCISKRGTIAFAQQHGFGRPRKPLSAAQSLQLIEDVLDRRGSAAAIAKRYNASYKKVLELAHRLLQCERFLPTWKNPLSSYYPSRAPRPPIKKPAPELAGQQALLLVDKICTRFLNGGLPALANENAFVETLSTIVVPREGSPDLNGHAREMVRNNFEAHLREAITMLRTFQTGLVN